mgnify:CR=1 FL=1
MNNSNVQQETIAKVKTALFMIANTMIVHEALASTGAIEGLLPLALLDNKNPIKWLEREWNKILDTNYAPIFEPSLKLLKSLPSHPLIFDLLKKFAEIAQRAVGNRVIFRHDLAGRLYHTLLLKEIAKGLATYYTSIPAATILARLAVDYVDIDWSSPDDISKLRIVDFACGSGTLLSAIYTEIIDRHVIHSDKPNIAILHGILLRDVLWGFDVLDYAVHLTSTALVLRYPEQQISYTNTYVLPLGVIEDQIYLGSLDMEIEPDKVIFPKVGSLMDLSTLPSPIRATIRERSVLEKGLAFKRPAIIIMNPPFARTGNVGKSSLFGHLPRADRREVLHALRDLGNKLVERLNLKSSFGRAGLAAYFILKSFQAVDDCGVLAFVLPRVMLSGSDWQSIREFLAKKGIFRYVIISDDPKYNWAWSENTVLSEMLLIFTKNKKSLKDYDTIVVYVRKRPKSALEAKIYADLIRSVSSELRIAKGRYFTATKAVSMRNNTIMYIYKIKRDAILRSASVNLNLVMGFHSSYLSENAYTLFVNKEFLGAKLPLIPLKEYITNRPYIKSIANTRKKRKKVKWDNFIGYDVANIRRKCLNKGTIPVRFLDALNMNTFSKLRINAKNLKLIHTNRECVNRAGRLSIAGIARIWLPTIGVIAAYSDEPIISQVAWTIPLNAEEAKIQALWLNSTPGLLHFLSMRQDSKGGFIQLKKKLLGELLVLNSDFISAKHRRDLVKTFDTIADIKLPDLSRQLKDAINRKGVRYQVDRAILGIFGVDIESDERSWNLLQKIYEELRNETLFH